MKVLVCTPFVPYPVRGGGRADVWRRIEALVRLGHQVMLLHQHEAEGAAAPQPEHFADMDRVLTSRFSFPVERSAGRTVRQLLRARRVPWGVAKTMPSRDVLVRCRQAVRDFGPEAVLLEGPWFGPLGHEFAREHGAAVLYRSHNVEFLYRRRQARTSSSLRNRVAWSVATIGLRRHELQCMRDARIVLEISLDDLEYWREQGVTGARWLPPLPELALVEPPVERVHADVLFVGGLKLPNNVSGVRWLVREVLPILRGRRPDLVLSVVGSAPDDDLRAELEAHEGVRTHFDVDSVHPHLFGARVLVNPVSVGSGVQLKMLDMLMTEAPVITRAQGVRGLPSECASQFVVADTVEDFAAAVLAQLEDPTVDLEARAQARELFTVAAVRRATEDVLGSPSST